MDLVNVRKGVFETNSSSSHSISIEPAMVADIDDFVLEDDGKYHIFPGEFGWGPEVYKDGPTKASYCYVHAMDGLSPNETTSPDMEMLKKVLEDNLDGEIVFDQLNDAGYIDHNSVGTACVAFESEDRLRDFIFGGNSILVIDNDNH